MISKKYKILEMQLKWYGFLCFCLYASFCSGQFIENFSDLNWPYAGWSGDLGYFVVHDGYLQLNDASASSINERMLFLELPSSTDTLTTWYFDWLMDFSPSSSNYACIWLQCDFDEEQIEAGYFLKLGGSSGDSDALELYFFDGSTSFLLGSSAAGFMHGDSVEKQFMVERSTQGLWTIYAKNVLDNDFEWIFDAYHNGMSAGRGMAFKCRYTKTRNEHFFMDSLMMHPIYVDTKAPILLQGQFKSEGLLQLTFDESLASSLESLELVGSPSFSDYWMEGSDIWINLKEWLEDGSSFIIQIAGISDLSGNVVELLVYEGIYEWISIPQRGSFIINEVHFHPDEEENPLSPPWEYIELYNPSSSTIDTEGLILQVGHDDILLDLGMVSAGSFIVLSRDSSVMNLEGGFYLEDLGSLSNAGGQLTILDSYGTYIDGVNYSSELHTDSFRASGGYSIERINPLNFCLMTANWASNRSPLGCSPGFENSVLNETLIPPLDLQVAAFDEGSQILSLYTNYGLDSISLELLEYSLPLSPEYNWNNGDCLEMFWPFAHEAGRLFHIISSVEIISCGDLSISALDTVQFGIGKVVKPGDIWINEVMFNPESDCPSYVEVSNQTDSLIRGDDLFLNYHSTTKTGWIPVDLPVLAPDTYWTLFSDQPNNCYNNIDTSKFVYESDIRYIKTDSGMLSLVHRTQNWEIEVVDSMVYADSGWGSSGRSIERVHADIWINAQAPEYATPTQNNQDFFPIHGEVDQPFELKNTLLSRNNAYLHLGYDISSQSKEIDIYYWPLGGAQPVLLQGAILFSGRGEYVIDSFQLEQMRSGFHCLMLVDTKNKGEQSRILLPFFVYL